MYRKNLFGDVTAIYNGTTKVAEYVYDAWGNCTVTTNVNGYGTRNPIRYRGYYWDNDLNLYYLLSRYYDPQTGRFINADTPDYLDPKTINGLNLYSYCNNNPVMNYDPAGTTSDNKVVSLAEDIGNLLLYGLYFASNIIEYFCVVLVESVTYDAGFGVGLGFDTSLGKLISVGLIARQDFLTIEKEAGPLTMEYTRIGRKYEFYAGLSFFFGFIGKGEESFSCFFTPEYDYANPIDIDLGFNYEIGAGMKLYPIVGLTFEIGFDLDYFVSNITSDRFATIYGYK